MAAVLLLSFQPVDVMSLNILCNYLISKTTLISTLAFQVHLRSLHTESSQQL